jgi:hypothetical protein
MLSAIKIVKEKGNNGYIVLQVSEGLRSLRAHKSLARGKNDSDLSKCYSSWGCSKISSPQKTV